MTPAEIDDVKARNPVAEVAMRMVALRARGAGYIGPCPICSPDPGSRDATRFEIKDDGWVCANCHDGGDVIKLTALVNGLDPKRDFLRVIALLGGALTIDPDVAAARERELAATRAARDKVADEFRQRERGELYEVWKRARPPWGTPVEAYLAGRGLTLPDWPHETARLRYVPDMPYYEGTEVSPVSGKKRARVIGKWPTMVAPIVKQEAGSAAGATGTRKVFSGLHYTYIDLARPKGKAHVVHPDTGEVLPSRKVRGPKAGGAIELVKTGVDQAPRQLIMGEGIETVLSVWLALRECGIDISRTEFWSFVDLGNIGGAASERVTHPTACDAGGRPLRVPGPDPDLAKPGVAIPASIDDVVALGDGDSDAVTTQCALYRGAQRFLALNDSVMVRIAWAPQGKDFNDLLLGETGERQEHGRASADSGIDHSISL